MPSCEVKRLRELLAAQSIDDPEIISCIDTIEFKLTSIKSELTHDSLTDLLNQKGFIERLDTEIAHLERRDPSQGSLYVAYGDMDGLKTVNDTYGHDTGDDALKHVAKVIAGVIRRTDFAARLHGDEFVIGFPKAMINIKTIIYRIQDVLATTPLITSTGQRISLSITLAAVPYQSGQTPLEVMDAADQLMLAKKKPAHR